MSNCHTDLRHSLGLVGSLELIPSLWKHVGVLQKSREVGGVEMPRRRREGGAPG